MIRDLAGIGTWVLWFASTIAIIVLDAKKQRRLALERDGADFIERSVWPYLVLSLICGALPVVVYFTASRKGARGFFTGLGVFVAQTVVIWGIGTVVLMGAMASEKTKLVAEADAICAKPSTEANEMECVEATMKLVYRGEVPRALELMTRACDAGNVGACFHFANAHEPGAFGPTDPAKVELGKKKMREACAKRTTRAGLCFGHGDASPSTITSPAPAGAYFREGEADELAKRHHAKLVTAVKATRATCPKEKDHKARPSPLKGTDVDRDTAILQVAASCLYPIGGGVSIDDSGLLRERFARRAAGSEIEVKIGEDNIEVSRPSEWSSEREAVDLTLTDKDKRARVRITVRGKPGSGRAQDPSYEKDVARFREALLEAATRLEVACATAPAANAKPLEGTRLAKDDAVLEVIARCETNNERTTIQKLEKKPTGGGMILTAYSEETQDGLAVLSAYRLKAESELLKLIYKRRKAPGVPLSIELEVVTQP